MRKPSWAIAAAILALVSFPPATVSQTTAVTREYDLKAVFLFHFAEFVEWPASAFADSAAPIVLGVLGENPFGRQLELTVANETVRGRRFEVVQYHRVEEATRCHILFISPSETPRLIGILAALDSSSVLTVGDSEEFAERDGMIGFVTAGDRLRLHVNLAVATAARLTISSKLLRQSQIVRAQDLRP